MLGWSIADIWLFAMLPVLLVLSGFFSGSETALFGLSETQRMQIRRGTGVAARAVESLLAHQRMLLITILISNMTVNVLYFVISSILLMKSDAGVIGEVSQRSMMISIMASSKAPGLSELVKESDGIRPFAWPALGISWRPILRVERHER